MRVPHLFAAAPLALVALVALVACAATLAPSASLTGPPATTARASSTSPSTSSPTPSPTPSPTVPSSLFGKVWVRLPVARPRIALTFDAGGNADGLPAIEQALDRGDVKRATFFLTGAWTRAFAGQAASIASSGWRLGNHTNTHPRLPDLTDAQVLRQVRRGRVAIEQATGVSPRPWFRFPYGAYDARTLALVNDNQWVAIGWTIDTLGWEGTSGGQSVESVVARVLDNAVPGAIVLMHVGANPDDHTTLDADALPAVIAGLRSAGYRFCTPDVLLERG